MARRRMFSLDVVDTDKFSNMTLKSRYLYYELAIRADDDGFVGAPNKIIRMVECDAANLEELIKNEFVIKFKTGVIVITDWKRNNDIRKQRYTPTLYQEEFSSLALVNNRYVLKSLLENEPNVVPNVIPMVVPKVIPMEDTDKDRLDKDRLDKERQEEINEISVKDIESSSGSSQNFNIFTYFQQRGFVSISSMMYHDIQTLIEMYSMEEVKQAVDIADQQGKHTLSYVKGVLQHRRSDGDRKGKSKEEIAWSKMEERIKRGEDPF